jgi:ribosomal protein L28
MQSVMQKAKPNCQPALWNMEGNNAIDSKNKSRRRFAVGYFTDRHQNHQLEDKRRVFLDGLRLWKGVYKMKVFQMKKKIAI